MKKLAAKKPVLLIIDDDPLTLTAIAAVLDMNDYECHCARDAEAAIKAAKSLPLDLIISDIDLENDNGFELCQRLRSLPGLESVPLLFLSGAQMPDAVRRARDAGGTYYLAKPFDPHVLIDLVDRTLWLPHLVHTRMRRGVTSRSLSVGVN